MVKITGEGWEKIVVMLINKTKPSGDLQFDVNTRYADFLGRTVSITHLPMKNQRYEPGLQCK